MDQKQLSFPDDSTVTLVADTFKLISDPNRLKILYLLCSGEQCVNSIACIMDMSPPAVAHHLKLLKSSGLLSSRRDGKEVYYKLSQTRYALTVQETVNKLFDCRCSVCASARQGMQCRCEKDF